ncbi:MAG: MarR family transcriptional regulator [Mycobacterium sp.]|nr:MarR family transcriptional regulator [Mycobacterium sp.]
MPAPGVPEEQHLDTERLARPDIRALLAVLSTASQLQMRGQADLRRMGSPLKIHEFDVLVAVVAHGPLRPSDITRKASLAPNPTTVSSIVSRLEKRGLVTRQSHPDFGGGVLVEATERGSEMLDQLFPEVERKVISWFRGHFSDEELIAIAEILERI